MSGDVESLLGELRNELAALQASPDDARAVALRKTCGRLLAEVGAIDRDAFAVQHRLAWADSAERCPLHPGGCP